MISAILYNHHKAAYPNREKTYTIMAIQYLGRLPRESEMHFYCSPALADLKVGMNDTCLPDNQYIRYVYWRL